jgi:predicted permease
VAIRISAGASPRHLLVQFLSESLVLSLAGGVAGLVSAALAIRLLIAFAPVEVPRLAEAAIDPRALGVGVLIATLTTLIFGLVPSHLLIRQRTGESLRSGGDRGSSRRTRRLYAGLVAGEVAFACVLLVGSALLVRSVHGMLSTDLGIDADEVVTTPIQLNRSTVDPARELERAKIWSRIADAHALLLDEIRREPGVLAAGAANFLPFGEGWRVPFAIDGGPVYAEGDQAPQVQIHSVSDGWFETLDARLSAGRLPSASDTVDAPPVAVVNRGLVERFLADGGDASPLGRRLRLWATGIGPLGYNLHATESTRLDGMLFEVVGVVEDVRNAPLGESVEPAIYLSARQFPFSEQHVGVRAVDRPAATAAIRNALARVAPAVPVGSVETWGEQVAARVAEPRLLMWLLTLFGGMAALLAAAGVYGLFSWSVATRRRELAIRLTLGAGAPRVARLIAGQSAVLVGGGLVAGLVLVFGSRPALDRVVYGISPTDAASTVTATAVLLVAAVLACLPPLLRAMRVDPVEGLRAD